jgi:predicted kinase
VPTLIHLNGPPAIGKSTLAALYADRHPGTLNLDIDRLHEFVGGWRDADPRLHDVLRPVAKAMASTYLRGGGDVILPQYLGRLAEVEAFELIARERGARFVEVVLFAERKEAIERFVGKTDATEWDVRNRRVVAELGGTDFLGAMHDRLVEVACARPDAKVLPSVRGAVEETYSALLRLLTPSGR